MGERPPTPLPERAAFVPRPPRAEVAVDARTIVGSAICQQIIRERDEAQNLAARYRAALEQIRGGRGTSSRQRTIVDDALLGGGA